MYISFHGPWSVMACGRSFPPLLSHNNKHPRDLRSSLHLPFSRINKPLRGLRCTLACVYKSMWFEMLFLHLLLSRVNKHLRDLRFQVKTKVFLQMEPHNFLGIKIWPFVQLHNESFRSFTKADHKKKKERMKKNILQYIYCFFYCEDIIHVLWLQKTYSWPPNSDTCTRIIFCGLA